MKNELIILGGMGPQASLRLHELLLTNSRQYHNGAPYSYPSILHASLRVPDFIGSKKRYNEALKLLTEACNSLPLDTCSAFGIACNTAHLMEDELPLKGTPFVSMISAVVKEAQTLGAKKIALLASPNTIKSGLYDLALGRVGIAIVKPNDSETRSLNVIIHQVIKGEDPTMLRPILDGIGKQLINRGADIILLGCTELPLVGLSDNLPAIDSLHTLAGAMLRKHYV